MIKNSLFKNNFVSFYFNTNSHAHLGYKIQRVSKLALSVDIFISTEVKNYIYFHHFLYAKNIKLRARHSHISW